ncbi:MAG: putative toxin-antitoxin system toxin component, PIN family [Ruminococcaceae bacterium]|nr:putative toxin-antitoxin system toxin component, PIN family [Oscillospiraceae bacterium]
MKYFAVIDTNVIVSAMLKNDSFPAQVLKEVLLGNINLLINEDILNEYLEVLSRKKFHFPVDVVISLMEEIKKQAIYVDAAPLEEYLPDPDDAVFYEIVMEARKEVDAYLVTGNLKHFPEKPFVVTPKEMIEIINKR